MYTHTRTHTHAVEAEEGDGLELVLLFVHDPDSATLPADDSPEWQRLPMWKGQGLYNYMYMYSPVWALQLYYVL